jgi:Na+-transporting NADH:ubiquinone oxidoreductase subunit NqrF
MRGDAMQMVTLGTLSLSGLASIAAMRQKLRATAEQLGLNSNRSARLAAAASDHAKDAMRGGPVGCSAALVGGGATQKLCVEFVAGGSGKFLRLGFDRVERLVNDGWRAYCEVEAVSDQQVADCRALMAEQGGGTQRGTARQQSGLAGRQGGGGGGHAPEV